MQNEHKERHEPQKDTTEKREKNRKQLSRHSVGMRCVLIQMCRWRKYNNKNPPTDTTDAAVVVSFGKMPVYTEIPALYCFIMKNRPK